MATQRVLVTGSNGQLAQAVVRFSPSHAHCSALSRAHLDIANRDEVRRAFETLKPDVVINGAAYNLVDKAESEGLDDALRANALGVGVLAQECRAHNARLVHFSTDFVFDGEKTSPYREDDATRPLGAYAASKLAGENLARSSSTRNIVIRVCRVFGPIEHGGSSQKPAGNFPLLMLKLAQTRDTIRVVNDQIGAPSHTHDLARGVWELLEKSAGGLYQLSNAGEVSFADYAREIFKTANVNCEVEGISTEEYGAPAKRPLYSTMSNEKAISTGVQPLRHWRDALHAFITSL